MSVLNSNSTIVVTIRTSGHPNEKHEEFLVVHRATNEELAGKITQKVVLTHNSVKNNACDVTYVLKEPQRHSKCVISQGMTFPISLSKR
jgi:hypothetical protein